MLGHVLGVDGCSGVLGGRSERWEAAPACSRSFDTRRGCTLHHTAPPGLCRSLHCYPVGGGGGGPPPPPATCSSTVQYSTVQYTTSLHSVPARPVPLPVLLPCREEGFFLEVLGSPATCFNASAYGALLVVDSEDEWYRQEVAKLAFDVEQLGLGEPLGARQ